MTDIQKRIYNLYLTTTRSEQSKPSRYRKNFDGFDQKPEYLYIQKLDQVFQQYPHLLRREFFEAPYRIYSEEKKYFDLKFFASTKGLSTCIAYLNLQDKKNPNEQFDFIKESLRFIYDFCKEKNIKLRDYVFYKTIIQPDCLKHLKEHRISWYLLFDIPGMLTKISELSVDEFTLYFGSDKNYGDFLVTLNKFPEVRTFIQKGLKLIEKKLDSPFQIE
jgi:hypothetical protein